MEFWGKAISADDISQGDGQTFPQMKSEPIVENVMSIISGSRYEKMFGKPKKLKKRDMDPLSAAEEVKKMQKLKLLSSSDDEEEAGKIQESQQTLGKK